MFRFSLKTLIYLTALIAVYGLVIRELTSNRSSFMALVGYAIIVGLIGYKLGNHVRADNP